MQKCACIGVLFLALVGLSGCPEISDATQACEDIVNATLPAAIDEIEARCEAQIQEAVESVAEELVDQFTDLINDILMETEVEVFTRLGCVRTDAGPGWDCSGSSLCN